MSNQIVIIISLVSASTLILLGINLYYLLKSRKGEPDDKYLLMHQRFDEMANLLKNHTEQYNKLVKLISDITNNQKDIK